MPRAAEAPRTVAVSDTKFVFLGAHTRSKSSMLSPLESSSERPTLREALVRRTTG